MLLFVCVVLTEDISACPQLHFFNILIVLSIDWTAMVNYKTNNGNSSYSV